MLVNIGSILKCPDIYTGDIVLPGDDNMLKRSSGRFYKLSTFSWITSLVNDLNFKGYKCCKGIGVLLDLFPGKDGNVWEAKVKTNSGEFIRPLQHLYPLKLRSFTNEVIHESVVEL